MQFDNVLEFVGQNTTFLFFTVFCFRQIQFKEFKCIFFDK